MTSNAVYCYKIFDLFDVFPEPIKFCLTSAFDVIIRNVHLLLILPSSRTTYVLHVRRQYRLYIASYTGQRCNCPFCTSVFQLYIFIILIVFLFLFVVRIQKYFLVLSFDLIVSWRDHRRDVFIPLLWVVIICFFQVLRRDVFVGSLWRQIVTWKVNTFVASILSGIVIRFLRRVCTFVT